jgi:hypothetical protein
MPATRDLYQTSSLHQKEQRQPQSGSTSTIPSTRQRPAKRSCQSCCTIPLQSNESPTRKCMRAEQPERTVLGPITQPYVEVCICCSALVVTTSHHIASSPTGATLCIPCKKARTNTIQHMHEVLVLKRGPAGLHHHSSSTYLKVGNFG